ncbi:MAG: peptidylprolyl isomerase [Bacteroidales bacterium]|nr:peptidylprolyl isomerase [Bacteroidales bacterium]
MKKTLLTAIFLLLCAVCSAQAVDPLFAKGGAGPKFKIRTTMGDITVQLSNLTPRHRDNFVKLVSEHFYDSLLFHRVIQDFMVQGGDPTSRHAGRGQMLGSGSLDYTVPAEFSSDLYHRRGALCAARMGDQVNPKKASSASQFYIVQGRKWTDRELTQMSARSGRKFLPAQAEVYKNEGGTPFLDGEYTVFGIVVEGMDVVDRIAAVRKDGADRPLQDVRIITIEALK